MKAMARPVKIGIIISLLCLCCLGIFLVAKTLFRYPPVFADCAWNATAFAWIDSNGNGIFEEGEPPFPEITIQVDPGGSFVTNWKGEAGLSAWLPGCPKREFKVYPVVPDGYRLTGSSGFTVDSEEKEKRLEFGFTNLPGVPTVTARPPSPVCTAHKIGSANRNDVTDIAIAADGSVWAATFGGGVAHYLADQNTWVRYTQNDGLAGNQVRSITSLRDGGIWIAAVGGASLWSDGKWRAFTVADGLVFADVYKVAPAPDGTVWFATRRGVSHYNPAADTWTNYTAEDGLADDFVFYAAATPDGSIWLPTLLGLSRITFPDSSGGLPQWTTYTQYVSDEGGTTPFESIKQIEAGPDGLYWFSGQSGFLQFDPKTGEWSENDISCDVESYIHAFAFGPDGSLWIASGSTTPIVYHSYPGGKHLCEVYDNRDGIPLIGGSGSKDDHAVAVAAASENTFWVATREAATLCTIFQS